MGKAKRIKEEKQHQSGPEPSAVNNPSAEDTPKPNPIGELTNPKNLYWVILSGAMALLVLYLRLLPQSAGYGIDSEYSVMLWVGIFVATLFRYIGKSGWMGFAVGSVTGLILFILIEVTVK